MLTVQQLQPTVHDVKELIKRGESVEGSFVQELFKQIGFKEEQMKSYKGCKELDELLSKGSITGGVAAVFNEVSHMKLFLGDYCHNCVLWFNPLTRLEVSALYSLCSPLAADVSRAILSVTEGEKMVEIEEKWFNAQDTCKDSSNEVMYDHTSLGLESFWGLFLIAGIAATLALALFQVEFLYKHRHILMQNDTTVCMVQD